MIDPESRYENVETAQLRVEAGDGTFRLILYKRRRFLPSTEGQTTVLEHTVKEGERLDHITAAYIGDPTQFFKLCDANQALHPDELTREVGRGIKITLLGF